MVRGINIEIQHLWDEQEEAWRQIESSLGGPQALLPYNLHLLSFPGHSVDLLYFSFALKKTWRSRVAINFQKRNAIWSLVLGQFRVPQYSKSAKNVEKFNLFGIFKYIEPIPENIVSIFLARKFKIKQKFFINSFWTKIVFLEWFGHLKPFAHSWHITLALNWKASFFKLFPDLDLSTWLIETWLLCVYVSKILEWAWRWLSLM